MLRYGGFPGGSLVKNPIVGAGDIRDVGSIPGSGRSFEWGNGNPLQYSCLGNPMDRGAWWATVYGFARVRHDWETWACMHAYLLRYSSGRFIFLCFLFIRHKILDSLFEINLYQTTKLVCPLDFHCIPSANLHFSSVQSLSSVWRIVAPWTAAHKASLSITTSQSLLKLMSIELVMPSNHLILCRPLLLLPSIFPSIRVFSNKSTLHMRWPNYWSFSFSISPSNDTQDWSPLGWTGWISLQSKGLLRVFFNTTV